jgi:pectate lyase
MYNNVIINWGWSATSGDEKAKIFVENNYYLQDEQNYPIITYP